MQSAALVIAVLVAILAGASSLDDATAMTDQGANDACRDFVRASLAYQKQLAEKVKALHGRPVYLFDATGFAAAFQDAVTADAVRYKTGTLDGAPVDAVLSVSAQASLQGAAGAQLYHRWAGQAQDLVVDDHGVRI